MPYSLNSETFSPLWKVIHESANEALDDQGIENFKIVLMAVIRSLPLGHCFEHATKYVIENRPDDLRRTREIINGKERNVGMAVYSWRMHNSVNRRLSKPEMTWEEYKKQYFMTKKEVSVLCHN